MQPYFNNARSLFTLEALDRTAADETLKMYISLRKHAYSNI